MALVSEVSGDSRSSQTMLSDPDYITYLLDPEQEYNCYFIVGNPALNIKVERIGVVKKMLLAHSVVLRAELQDSKIAEKDDVKVIDMYPDTFKNLLRYTYGYDNTDALSFDEADNLLYAAEKYMITKLKNKLATCLISMLSYENICCLMNNPACYKVLELNSAITEIIQFETDEVLSSPHFLGLSSEAFLSILQQETLNVPEIEIWRAAIKWAKHRAYLRCGSEDGEELRKELEKPLQHIRICSLTSEEICKEVAPANILTDSEFKTVCVSCGRSEKGVNLKSICNEVEARSAPGVASEPLQFNLNELSASLKIEVSVIKLTTMNHGIELLSLGFCGYEKSHECNCTISIEKDRKAHAVVTFQEHLSASGIFSIPIIVKNRNVQLLPNSKYSIKVSFYCSQVHKMWKKSCQEIRNKDDFVLDLFRLGSENVSPFCSMKYKALKIKANLST